MLYHTLVNRHGTFIRNLKLYVWKGTKSSTGDWGLIVRRQEDYCDLHIFIILLIGRFGPYTREYNCYWPVFQDIIDVSYVVYCDEEAARAAVHQAVLLAGEAHGRRVHYRHHVRNVLADETVEQVFVAILHIIMYIHRQYNKRNCEFRSRLCLCCHKICIRWFV